MQDILTNPIKKGIISKVTKESFNMRRFIKKEPVLVISFAAAVISCFFIMPDREYISYIDFRVLALLFSLMSVVAGLQKSGCFEYLSQVMLKRTKTASGLCLILTLLSFFLSMFVTNDVALIMCVPFAIAALGSANQQGMIIKTVVLQTVAANLGSMAMPVGNPQNLFLFSYYNLGMGEFFSCVWPYAAISLIGIIICSLTGKRKLIDYTSEKSTAPDKKRLIIYLFLFALCLLTVVRVVNFIITAFAVLAVMLIWDRELIKKNDYCLLLTFVCFFVFSGNLGRIEKVSSFLEMVLSKNAVLCSALSSQVISNVPAAVLLAPFTKSWRGLLIGVSIGGLGTPVASLASLISLKIYANSRNSRVLDYMKVFTVYNMAGLVLLIVVSQLL